MNLFYSKSFQQHPSLSETVSITQIWLSLLKFTQMILILSKVD